MKLRTLIPMLGLTATLGACETVGEMITGVSAAERRGEIYAETFCAECHEIGAAGPSPRGSAPNFGDISRRYGRLGLERELLAIGEVGHYEMKRLEIDRNDIDDLVAYVEGLR